MYQVIIVIHVIVTVLLIGIILIQRSDSDGMGGLGGGGGNLLSGRTSANLLTRTTAILATIFILTSLGLSIVNRHATKGSIADVIESEGALPATATPAAPAPAPVVPKPGESKKAPSVPKPE